VLPLEGFNEAQREKILRLSHPASEWEMIFGAIQSGHLPEWLKELANDVDEEELGVAEEEDQKSLQLLSPLASRGKHGVFEIIPSFSFDSTGSLGQEENGDTKEDYVDGRLAKVESRIDSLKTKLTRPFLDIDASYSVLSSDINKIYDRVKSLTIAIGPLQRYETSAEKPCRLRSLFWKTLSQNP